MSHLHIQSHFEDLGLELEPINLAGVTTEPTTGGFRWVLADCWGANDYLLRNKMIMRGLFNIIQWGGGKWDVLMFFWFWRSMLPLPSYSLSPSWLNYNNNITGYPFSSMSHTSMWLTFLKHISNITSLPAFTNSGNAHFWVWPCQGLYQAQEIQERADKTFCWFHCLTDKIQNP